MLDECPKTNESKTVLRLASVLADSETILIRLINRGSNPADVFESIPFIKEKISLSLEETIDDMFRAHHDTTPRFREGRFGDGSIPVYYSAIEEDTCREEVSFHLQKQAGDLVDDLDPRYFRLIKCNYDGATLDLRGKERQHPELTSRTNAGYPYCQALGLEAVELGIDGFLAPSARRQGGTCVPVFSRAALSEPRVGYSCRATVQSGSVVFEEA